MLKALRRGPKRTLKPDLYIEKPERRGRRGRCEASFRSKPSQIDQNSCVRVKYATIKT